ncbi:DUF3499 domain-containing protein [Streptomyces sp. CJ_13]|nr:hypothetical protein EES41_14995 [Streptomyces sp. ADI95-16]MBT1186709.1 DUF3499 domain-containing protein [Streptomyces sp. CJ_13]
MDPSLSGPPGRVGTTTRASDRGVSRRGPVKSAVPSNVVSPVRRCSRTACGRPAVATLTYVYADSTAVLGPLATYAEPHCYDLCAEHSERLTAPRGWDVVRLSDGSAPSRPSGDDLEALANAVREAARPHDRAAEARGSGPNGPNGPTGNGPATGQARRGHLRVLRSPDS